MNQDTKKTINEKEKDVLAFWQEHQIFEKSIQYPANDSAKGNYSFYDGPPFATGLPHFGHILAGTIKDAIPRYQTMKGNSVRRVWGWDCHGLPIENLIEKKLGLQSKKDIEAFGIDKFNRDAYESVLQYEKEWKDVIPRLGRWVDMEHPYKTMDASYTESIWWAWKTLYEKGLAYEGSKMMHICPRCETPLAQSEVGLEYHDVTDLSVTAKFELVGEPGMYILAWTTTPWTLPGNTALAVNKDIVYVKVKSVFEDKTNYFILAKSKVGDYFKESQSYEIIEEFLGDTLIGKVYKPVFPYFIDKEIENKENIWKIWHADFITEDAGTGIAHEAPAFGAEDMELAKANNIPIIKHVKMDGTFTSDVTDFAGMKVKVKDDTQSADIEIIKWLAHHGSLFEKHKIIHSYPLCWRCKTPLLNYATSSWFVDVPKMKDKLIAENNAIGWTPAHIRDGRFGKWLEGAREWAVSRSRYWGAPLPVWKSEDGDIKIIGSLHELAELSSKKPKNTYFAIRHGEADSNIKHILDSARDPNNHLTDHGKEQCHAAGILAREKGVDLIIASPYIRTQETAHIIAEHTHAEVLTNDKLQEFNTGIYSGGSVDAMHAHQRSRNHNIDEKIEGGESYRDVMNRMMSLLHECEEMYQGKTILFVTHGSPLWMLTMASRLATDEEVKEEMLAKEDVSPANAHLTAIVPKLIPRDETGAINLHRPYIDEVTLTIDGKVYTRIPDVFDCWFESGSMPFASLHYPFENKSIFEKNYPADFIAEGMDQTRGWFYSLINLGVGLFDRAPYKHVIVNGIVLSESGVKLSKSEKNYTDPMLLVEKYGADAMRYALLSSPVVKGENIQFSDSMIEDVYKKIISRLENVVSLYEMNKPDTVAPKATSQNVLDIWMITLLHQKGKMMTTGYDTYQLDAATSPILDIVDNLSVWYTRRSRSRLKGDEGESEQMQAYETLAYVLLTLTKLMAPVMPFLAERLYKQLDGIQESVHLESWPILEKHVDTDEILSRMTIARDIVSLALMKRTEAKIGVRQPLQKLTFRSTTSFSNEYLLIIQDEVNVKEVYADQSLAEDIVLDTTITSSLQKEGDMRNFVRAIQDTRKQYGFSAKDTITLITSYLLEDAHKEEVMKTCNIVTIEAGESTQSVELSHGAVTFDIKRIG